VQGFGPISFVRIGDSSAVKFFWFICQQSYREKRFLPSKINKLATQSPKTALWQGLASI
jgi:hypothetical protein